MSDCCSPGIGFPNASLMQQLALNQPVVWSEICAIQQSILAASSQCQPGGGQMCVTVGGTTPMTFVTGLESVSVISGGSDYVVDQPRVFFRPPVGVIPSVTATADLVTNGGSILAVNITDPGQGYQPVSASLDILSSTGLGAVILPLVNASGQIVNVNIVSAGTGYQLGDIITTNRAVLPDPAYVDAQLQISALGPGGEIAFVSILNPGSGYQPSVTEIEIVSSLDPLIPYPLGGGFWGSVLTDLSGAILGVTISNGGSGYVDFPPYLVINDPGTGAVTSVTLTGDSVGEISVINPGSQYTSSATGAVLNPPTAGLPNPPAPPAQVSISVRENSFNTDPNLYWQVWAGVTTNRQIDMQLNQVLSYFKGLKYSIQIQSNPATGNTIQWKICW